MNTTLVPDTSPVIMVDGFTHVPEPPRRVAVHAELLSKDSGNTMVAAPVALALDPAVMATTPEKGVGFELVKKAIEPPAFPVVETVGVPKILYELAPRSVFSRRETCRWLAGMRLLTPK